MRRRGPALRLVKTSETPAGAHGRTGESVGRPRGRLVWRIRGALVRRAVRRYTEGAAAAALVPIAVGLVFAALIAGTVLGAAFASIRQESATHVPQ